MKNVFKILLLSLATIFILFQLYPRPKKNIETAPCLNHIALVTTYKPAVKEILQISCNDCHSNNTRYPWYSAIQPFAWWLGDHVKEGKKELNFSEFGTYSLRRKYKKFKEIIDEVEEDEMPLKSYIRVHRNAILSAEEKSALITWATGEINKMEAQYPSDSLKSRK
ncbi:MAG: heme-binding domain-containing protein [Ferruginibacter sp.]